MKNLVFASLGALALSLGACQNLPQVTQELSALIQADTQAICQFLPTAETLDQIVAAYVPGSTPIVQAANQIATQVCAAVTTAPPASLRGGKLRGNDVVITVNGKSVVVHGGFVTR